MAIAAVAAGDAPAGGTSYGSPGYRFYVLLLLTAVYSLNFIDRNLVNVIGQDIIAEFKLDDASYGFLNGPPFALFYALMGIPLAMMADRMNRIVLLALAISVWSIMAALCGLANSFIFLLCCRIGVAIGEAGGTPPSSSIIGDYFKPTSRANALGIYSMGVTLGGALSNFFGGPIAASLKGPVLKKFFTDNGWTWALNLTDWDKVEGWRVAFVVIGLPGVLLAVILLLTCKEPPRGYSDPPGTVKVSKASMLATLKEISPKFTFWSAAFAASLTALVGYGLSGFQAPLAARLHGVSTGDFAWNFGGPLALFSAFGTFLGGFVIDRVSPRWHTAVAWVPGIGLLLAVPLYIWAWNLPTADVWIANPQTCSDVSLALEACKAAIAAGGDNAPRLISHGGSPQIALWIWGIGAMFHYAYLTSQYTIAQGVVGARSRASSTAILLLMVALIGNGIGPYLVGWISDLQMGNLLSADPTAAGIDAAQCRLYASGRPGFPVNWEQIAATMSPEQQGVCKSKYGEGLKDSMIFTALIFIPAAIFWFLSSMKMKKDMVVTGHA